jgi:hypothetical protein
MINLLPPTNVLANNQEYRARRQVAAALLALVLLLSSLVLMGALYLSAHIGRQSDVLSPKGLGNQDLSHNQTELKKLEQVLSLVNKNQSGQLVVAQMVDPILAVKIPGVKITGFDLTQKVDKTPAKTTLTVFAGTRKSAADFVTVLRQIPGVAKVNYPVLIKDQDLNLSLDVIWVDQKDHD